MNRDAVFANFRAFTLPAKGMTCRAHTGNLVLRAQARVVVIWPRQLKVCGESQVSFYQLRAYLKLDKLSKFYMMLNMYLIRHDFSQWLLKHSSSTGVQFELQLSLRRFYHRTCQPLVHHLSKRCCYHIWSSDLVFIATSPTSMNLLWYDAIPWNWALYIYNFFLCVEIVWFQSMSLILKYVMK